MALTQISSDGVKDGAVVNADINASAAIAFSKLQDVSATDRILGRDSSGAGDIEEITPANVRTMLNVEDGADVTDSTNVNAAGAVMNSDLDGKGEILIGDGSGDPTALAVGTNDHVLTAASGEATGVKWAAVSTTDTLSFRNAIINGSCQVDQRNNGSTKSIGPNASSYCADRILIGTWGTGELTYTTQRVDDDAPTGFKYSQKVTVATAESSGGTPAADDRSSVQFRLEGNTLDRLDLGQSTAKDFTISFWVKSSLTGNFGLVVPGDSVANKQYGALYAISSANTWEKKTIKIPGPTSGTWKSDNSNAISLKFGLYVGSNKVTSDQGIAGSGSWQTGYQAQGVTGQVQLGGTSSATWQITGVQLEEGSTATDFEHRSYGDELRRCQRYFQQWTGENCGNFAARWNGEYNCVFAVPLVTPLRNTPSVECKANDTSGSANGEWKTFGVSNAATSTNVPTVRSWTANTPQIMMNQDGQSNGSDDRVVSIQATLSASGFFRLSAEL